jgi:hypothetical protein
VLDEIVDRMGEILLSAGEHMAVSRSAAVT